MTMKYLIRNLHISTPVEHVMSILGKKYPVSQQVFRDVGLPGEVRSPGLDCSVYSVAVYSPPFTHSYARSTPPPDSIAV